MVPQFRNYFDKIINDYIASPVLYLGHVYTYKDIDRGLIEKFGPWGIVTSIKSYVATFRLIQTGYIYNYLLLIIFSIYIIISIYFFIDILIVPLSLLFFLIVINLFFPQEI